MENINIITNQETGQTKKKRELTGSDLKVLAIIVMFIDHFAAVVLDSKLIQAGIHRIYTVEDQNTFLAQYGTIYNIDRCMRLIGRLGFPIFCFLLVEGFTYTHSRIKYLINLCLFALISEIPFNLALSSNFVHPGYQNVFFTLALGLIAMIFMEMSLNHESFSIPFGILSILGYLAMGITALHFIANSGAIGNVIAGYTEAAGTSTVSDFTYKNLKLWTTGPWLGLGILLLTLLMTKKFNLSKLASIGYALLALSVMYFVAQALATDYAGGGVLTIAAFYAFKRRGKGNVKSALAGCTVLTILQLVECTSFFIALPIGRYNNKRGKNIKYFFYAFYPIHLFVLYLITLALGYNSLPW